MTNKEKVLALITEICGENTPYILRVGEIKDLIRYADRQIITLGEAFFMDKVRDRAEFYNRVKLTPANAKVGDGATVNLYTDRHACTIVKITKRTITVQRDKATLDPNFKPIYPDGFFCTNQGEQTYTYERDTNGKLYTIYWSEKHNQYGKPNNYTLSRGRHEFYDYNFVLN